jgi:hypothetical protein
MILCRKKLEKDKIPNSEGQKSKELPEFCGIPAKFPTKRWGNLIVCRSSILGLFGLLGSSSLSDGSLV